MHPFTETVPMDISDDRIYFDDISILEVWRLFIDGVKQKEENGWKQFEKREPGYLQAVCKAMAYALNHIDDDLTVALIQTLHKLAMEGVSYTRYKNTLEKPGEIRSSWAAYYIAKDTLTKNGIREIIDKMQNQSFLKLCFQNSHHEIISIDYNCNLSHEEKEQLILFLYHYVLNGNNLSMESYNDEKYNQERQQLIQEELIAFITDYNFSMETAKNQENKIRAILIFIKNCQQLHVFPDGNGRVFYMILLYALFAKNAIPLPLMENINHIDGYSLDELMLKIRQGWENKQSLLMKGNLFEANTIDILMKMDHKEKKYYISALKPLMPYFKSSQFFEFIDKLDHASLLPAYNDRQSISASP